MQIFRSCATHTLTRTRWCDFAERFSRCALLSFHLHHFHRFTAFKYASTETMNFRKWLNSVHEKDGDTSTEMKWFRVHWSAVVRFLFEKNTIFGVTNLCCRRTGFIYISKNVKKICVCSKLRRTQTHSFLCENISTLASTAWLGHSHSRR